MGDSCLSIELDNIIDPAVNSRCVALAADLERRRLRHVRDIVPGYCAVAVFFDPLLVRRESLQEELEQAAGSVREEPIRPETALIEVAVDYGGSSGPDLASVAEFAGCSEDEVVERHCAPVYRVYMMGFLPGFAYLGTVDSKIAMPRLSTPRIRVPAGSVGIAGPQTGIYPCETPGGWRLIGRTSASLFDASREEPSLLRAGDRVKFVAM
jgi:inhibitor of KinA